MTRAKSEVIQNGHSYKFDRTVRGFASAEALAQDWNINPDYHAIIKYGTDADGKRVYHVYYRRCYGDKFRKGTLKK